MPSDLTTGELTPGEQPAPSEPVPDSAEEQAAEVPAEDAPAGEAVTAELPDPAAPGPGVSAPLPAAPEPTPESNPEPAPEPAPEHGSAAVPDDAAGAPEAAPDHAEAPATDGHAEAPATQDAGAPTGEPESHAAAPPAEGHGAADQEAAPEQQQAAIPKIPPPPEQLPYWERYRQPFNMDDKRPRIAVVLSGLGLSDSATEAAINKLPPAVTLSFSPYARNLERWIALARARGHEVMLDLPMEPATFPNEDPGPQGLLTTLSAEDNLDRLDWVLSRGSAYVGLAGAMGSRFTTSRTAVEPILQEVKNRGLIFLDRRTTEHSLVSELAEAIDLPRAINNRSIDERQASRVAIDARLAQIERIALTDGYAVAMAQPYPVTLDRLAEWATELGTRGLVIAPISALTNLQKAP